jgi:hypothetical protein
MAEESPNTKELDKAVKALLKDAADKDSDDLLVERRRKAIMTAISWEKVRNAIMDKDDTFEPENL